MMKLKENVRSRLTQELSLLGPSEIESFFEHSKKWNLASTLSKGGSAIFPHTLVRTCGDLVAAAVLGCLDSCLETGARRVIALGVLHSLDRAHIISARRKAFAGEDISSESCWGIFGPLFPGDQAWQTEYSLSNFCFLWDYEVKRRKLAHPPELILAYPCLSNNEPEKLPGMEQLKSYLPDSVIVATTDFCHHGVAYNTPNENLMHISNDAEQFSRDTIEVGLEFIQQQNYVEYGRFSHMTISDGNDVGQVLMYLKGPLKSQILDSRVIDTSYLYQNDPSPSWTVASLIELTPIAPFCVVN